MSKVSKRQIQEFEKHPVWQEIMSMYQERCKDIIPTLVKTSPSSEFVHSVDGRVVVVRSAQYWLGALEEAEGVLNVINHLLNYGEGDKDE